MITRLFSLCLLLTTFCLAIACGGGGGSDATASSTVSGALYSVDYLESVVNQPSMTGSYVSSTSFGELKGATSGARALYVGAQADAGELQPQLKLALKYGAISSANLTGTYHVVAYGLADSASQVSVAQYSLDFSSEPPSIVTEGVASNAAGISGMLPSGSDNFIVGLDGKVTWGDWVGGVSENEKTLLLSKNKVFLLGSKVATAQNLLEGQTANMVLLFQYDQPSQNTGSAYGSLSFSGGEMTSTVQEDNLTTSSDSNFPNSGSRYFAQDGSASSLIKLYSSSSYVLGTTTPNEQGFVGSEEFLVVINPDNSVRPSLSIGIFED
jgi:hypothetical protein